MTTQRTLLLIDGSSYLYRAYYAMPDLRAVAGDASSHPTGAIRGIINMLQSLKKDYPCERAACVFDAKGPTFRDAIYPAYKGHRSPMPDDLRQQIKPIHEIIQLLGWPILEVEGVEADDVIGTLAKSAAHEGYNVVISSGDKDLAQLVNEHITIIDTMSGKKRDVPGVEAEFGVAPFLMVDYQTLVGDAIDNVPGVEKVGPKTAVKLLKEYGSLDKLIANADKIAGAVGVNFRKAQNWLPTGRALLTIKTDCDLSAHTPDYPSVDGLRFKAPRDAELKALYEAYGFKGLLKSLPVKAPIPAVLPTATTTVDEPLDDFNLEDSTNIKTHYQCITTLEAFDQLLQKIQQAEIVSIDTETTSLNEMQAKIVGISVCCAQHEAAYIPVGHEGAESDKQLPLLAVLEKLTPWLQNPKHAKLGQHSKYDRHVFANHGIVVQGYKHDTMLQSYVLEVHRPHNLTSLAERFLHQTGLSYEDLCGKGAHQISFAKVDVNRAMQYACEDADMTFCISQVLLKKLQVSPHLQKIYGLEMACSDVLFWMERHGVLISVSLLKAQSDELGRKLKTLEAIAHELAGETFNLSSPKQIGEIFFQKLGFPIIKKTAKGQPSTDEDVLEKLALDYALPAKILEYRSLFKLKSTYADKLPTQVFETTGRIHTHYAQAVTVTGRLSSLDPNLQNIPIRTSEGRKIREAFIAPPGACIVSADYSQIELRIMAHLSEDEALLRAFRTGEDVHRATASEVFGTPVDALSSEQRRFAKVINFGLIYGMSAYGLARTLGIDNASAKNYIERYFERYPGVKQYMEDTRQKAKSLGYVETVMGRRLYLPEINSPNGPRRAAAERAAINAPMQGTAADLIKLSMVSVQQALIRHQKRSKLIMQVHDELLLEVVDDEVNWVRQEVPALMAQVATLRVPLIAEVGAGKNWDEAH